MCGITRVQNNQEFFLKKKVQMEGLSFSHIKTYCKITVRQHGRLKDE